MPTFVLDASFTIAMLIESEMTEGIEALAEDVVRGGVIVPILWRLEVANALAMAIRTNRVTATKRHQALINLDDFGIDVDSLAPAIAFSVLSDLADKHRLTIYDAAYLELAMRAGYPLVSLDRALRAAAQKEGVAVLPA